jgi:hypothetical protein
MEEPILKGKARGVSTMESTQQFPIVFSRKCIIYSHVYHIDSPNISKACTQMKGTKGQQKYCYPQLVDNEPHTAECWSLWNGCRLYLSILMTGVSSLEVCRAVEE